MYITLKLEKSVTSIPELSRAIDAFETIDEIYRLIKSKDAVYPGAKVDFRRKPFKDIKGGELEKFNVTSPPEITVNADNLWIAAILFVVVKSFWPQFSGHSSTAVRPAQAAIHRYAHVA